MESVVRKLFGRKAGTGNGATADGGQLHPAMAAELLRIEYYQAGLGRAAVNFVASGERPDTVDAIAALGQANLVYTSPYQQVEPKIHELIGQTSVALVKGEIPPGPQVLRLLQVRIATRHVRAPWHTPMSDAELVISGFGAMLFEGLSLMQQDYRVRWDAVIPIRTLFAHFQQIGGTMADLFAFILRRSESEFVAHSAGSWSASQDLADYLTIYPAAMAQAMERGEAKQRATAITLAEHHQVMAAPEIEAMLVAMLTRPFDKHDRELATSALARLAPDQLLALLQRDLAKADIDTRYGLVQAAGRSGAPEMLALLAERVTVEKAAKVKAAIAGILEAGAADERSDAAGYAAIDGSFVTLPPRKDLGAEDILPPTETDRIEFAQLVERIEQRRRDSHAAYLEKYNASWSARPTPPVPYPRDLVEQSFAALTQGAPLPGGDGYQLAHAIRFHNEGQAWLRQVLDRQPLRAALQLLKASAFDDVGGLVGIHHVYRQDHLFGVNLLRGWLEQGQLDLRDLVPGDDLRSMLNRQSYGRYDPAILSALQALPQEAVWPWLVENMDVLDEAIGLKPTDKPIPLDRALDALAMLPVVPQRYFAKLLDIAVAERRPLRRQAVALLRGARDLVTRIEALLDDKRQQVRISAAIWLADIRFTTSETALRKRLKKEKNDPVRAALIESLQRLGFDLSDVIGPATLIAEAEAALAKGAPELPAWLTAHGLPPLHFRDGSTVPPMLLQHWLALAIRLKDPAASGQFGIYLDQLLPQDARTLSNRVLDAWIAFDTQASSLEDATAYAQANYQQYHAWAYNPNKTAELRDQVIAHLIREKTGELINSGSDTKGVLALACRADPVFAANRVRWFLKHHGRRSNQAMALLEALAGIGHPTALQVVIAASARLKQKSTQARAAEIAERYAEDRGWSFDELADRTVPTAGFDDDGVIELPCGEDGRVYTARLDAMLAIHLFNPDGKPVKTLPAGTDEASRAAKKALSAAKKELTQIIELQGSRLFEAMCVERAWAVADWQLAFRDHPVMRRLVERLVWQGLDADGNALALFRPTQEGDYTDAADNPVDVARFAQVRLAHGALTDAAECAAWTAHLKDYEITPLLAQFDTLRLPLSAQQGEEETITDRLGWKADSLTFRGVAEKRGYERIMRDGGGCNEYQKSFPSHGITATIFHTGSYAVEENNPVALKELRFARQGHRGAYRLKDVPPVMLAECRADYHAVAARGAFDPEWEKVSPW
ncbi:DUF4132 domain-containing protein [Altererythrobacter xixiisoli]|uniref:DUF4132 domain-containing protein n=2 Tax=Croceibacterium xixiisoli TaxID=1476466 RepID=A0A6I4TX05_9SPHN|nr:DUF4132 domain-containing protein [Croceibacterium xixiisoli]